MPQLGARLPTDFKPEQFHARAGSEARRPNLTARRVNVDFPAGVVEGLDHEAARLGVTRQALIKMWIAERLG